MQEGNWYKSAAPNDLFQRVGLNDEYAMVELAYRYETGAGVERDMAMATTMYERAAGLGNAYARQRLAALNPGAQAPVQPGAAPAPALHNTQQLNIPPVQAQQQYATQAAQQQAPPPVQPVGGQQDYWVPPVVQQPAQQPVAQQQYAAPQPAQQPVQPQQSAYVRAGQQAPPAAKKKSKAPLIIIVAVLAVAAVGAGVVFGLRVFSNDGGSASTVATSSAAASMAGGEASEPAPSMPPSSVPAADYVPSGPVTLNVATYARGTGFDALTQQWADRTGNTALVSDMDLYDIALLPDEGMPDVLYFSAGYESAGLVRRGALVPVAEIQEMFPEYAANMKQELLPVSAEDGQRYALPMADYWIGLYVNKSVLAACGVDMPGPGTSWEEFLAMCDTIKGRGYVPIALAMNEPYCWFDYLAYNQSGILGHQRPPRGESDPAFSAWVGALNELTRMHRNGYFPADTLDRDNFTGGHARQMFCSGEAAFYLDTSRIMPEIERDAGKLGTLANLTVTYVPGTAKRPTTQLLGGLTSGYMITRAAWNDPDKRAACVSYISTLTGDDAVNVYAEAWGGTTPQLTALAAGQRLPAGSSSLGQAAQEMLRGATGCAPENLYMMVHPEEVRITQFAYRFPDVVQGRQSAEGLVRELLGSMAPLFEPV